MRNVEIGGVDASTRVFTLDAIGSLMEDNLG